MENIATYENTHIYYEGEGKYFVFSDEDKNDLGLGYLFNDARFEGDLTSLMKYIVNNLVPYNVFELFSQIHNWLK